ncbi:MAG TPA: Gmad2 immunoglobulin-like domain-containing protein [Actinomycetota bacterium]|jgi:spore germination protein GerM|nr:Gmad2 immunoglobulin-like domain-containing protein [Actinomycetota bacterium]
MVGMRHTSRIGTGLLALALLAVACGGNSNTPAAGGNTPSPEATPSATPQVSPAANGETNDEPKKDTTYEVWFVEKKGRFLQVAYRSQESTPRIGTAALESLLGGPQSGEGKVSTAIPADATLLGLTIQDGLATVDLSSEFESGGGSFSMLGRLAQVVFTITQFPTVDRVAFEIEGEPVDVFSSEGIALDKPQTRADFEDIAAPIVVESPRPGATVSSPVDVTGNANVFEATVSMRIVDSSGNVLVRDFTTATCGTGCRGGYSKKLKFEVAETQAGFIEVFEESAEDGSPIFKVRLPVMLKP